MTGLDGNVSKYPSQKLPRSKKTKEWGRSCVDWILTNSTIQYVDLARMKANYDLYNGIIDEADFTYVTNPYGIDNKFPARFHNYDIITPKLNLLLGEEIKRAFNFRVAAVNSDAVSQLQEKRKELLIRYLESELLQELQMRGAEVQNPETGEVMTPPEIERYMSYSETDIREASANKIAKYLIKRENLEFKFNKGFSDGLIAGREIYYVGSNGSDPIVERVNPLDFDHDINPDLDNIEDGQWAKHTKYCTISDIIDLFGDELTDQEIAGLETNGSADNHTVLRFPGSQNSTSVRNDFSSSYIPVTRVEWKSLRKIGFLKYYDENFEEQELIVDETYKPNKEFGETIEWRWINEVWEGTKIGASIYVCIKPKKVQYRTMDNPSICKLGYVGATYYNKNSKPSSIIDLVKHHQYLYNVIMYRMEFEIAKAKGKKMIMDVAQIPKSSGINLEKWMYYFESMGIAFVNSFEEGSGKFAGQTSTFNQFNAVDMSLSQSVGQYIGILDKIEQQVETLLGVSRQRQGAISSTETVGGVERAVVQSSHITEPLFYMHSEIKKNVISHLIETAKVVYPESKKINYIGDDMTRVMIELDEGFVNADYGVFVTNGSKEIKALEDLRLVAGQSAQSGMIKLSELATILSTDSMAEIKQSIISAERRAEQQQQAQAQQEQQMAREAQEAEFMQMEYDHDRLDQREYIKGELDKEREAIKALGFAQDQDVNNNGIPDVMEYEKLLQSKEEHNDKMNLERDKLNLESEKIKSQERIAEQKAKIDAIKARKSGSSSSKK